MNDLSVNTDHNTNYYIWQNSVFSNLLDVSHCKAPLSMRFSRQEYWSGLPSPPPGNLPDPGIKPTSLTSSALARGFFATSATREAHKYRSFKLRQCDCSICVLINIINCFLIKMCRWETKEKQASVLSGLESDSLGLKFSFRPLCKVLYVTFHP